MNLHYADVPYQAWSEFASLIDVSGGENRELLKNVLTILAKISRAGYVDSQYIAQYIPDVVSNIRRKVDAGKFHLFMDCLAVLCNDGDLMIEDLNEYLEDNEFGYRAERDSWTHKIKWNVIGCTDKITDDIKEKVKVQEEYSKYNMSEEELCSFKEKVEENMEKNENNTKVFITHSSEDEQYIRVLTSFLRGLGVPNNCIICTTDPRHKVPNGLNALNWLKNQFLNYNLHMIFVLSEYYYNSTICLNEMGAAWIVAKRNDAILLKDFSFKDLKAKGGVLDANTQGVSADWEDDKIKGWLQELRTILTEEFELKELHDIDWDILRNEFINGMKEPRNTQKSTGVSKRIKNDAGFDNIDSKEDFVVQAIISVGGVAYKKQIAEIMGVSEKTATLLIKKALEKGKIIAEGNKRNMVYKPTK